MSRLSRAPILVSCVAIAVALSGCQKKATGQVAAVVNGDEITLQEVNGALRNANIPDGAEKDKARAAVVQRLIDKRLIEQQAKAAGTDRDPEFLTRQREVDQALLLEFYAKRVQDTLRVPDKSAIDKFISDHPLNFAGRTIFSVDQIRFPAPTDQSVIAGMKDLHTLQAIMDYLTGKGIKFDRGASKVDSAQVPPQMMQQVLALPPGEPFIVPTPQGVVASVITGKEVQPLAPEQAQPMAVQMMRAQELDKVIQQRLKDARAKAKIEYQPGFAPAQTTK
ncbi:EpsD family peptidyl-prolyl cis-trans isomerase [Sphingomonas sp. MA1305]|uniref:EpsD family peptidyl-prolyl cis-trans isomerase n=1 Tax=Sphingomonas sp. MA1305 TaxID=2479204 RepID=UPI0022B76087|nr:EpsD family peptidyl-prolyl cis-trans isomerase [Sphingomonas sp. MA1305]